MSEKFVYNTNGFNNKLIAKNIYTPTVKGELNINNEPYLEGESYEKFYAKINKLTKNSEEKIKIKQALFSLNNYEKEIKGYDIDLTYKDGFFYLIGNKKNAKDKLILNIAIKGENLNTYLNSIKTLLNEDDKLILSGLTNHRNISKSNGERLISLAIILESDYNQNINNIVEELYKFTQTLKGIPENEWIVKNHINGEPLGTKKTIGFDNIPGIDLVGNEKTRYLDNMYVKQ